MDQGSRLIEVFHGKGNAEFHRGERNAFFDIFIVGIELCYGFAAVLIVGAHFKVSHQPRCNIILNGHAVGRNIPAAIAVQVYRSHLQRVMINRMGNDIHDPFNGHHALGPAKTAKSGVGHSIGTTTK